jgi:hypothetical protein
MVALRGATVAECGHWVALPRPGPSRGFGPAGRGYNKAGAGGVPKGLPKVHLIRADGTP